MAVAQVDGGVVKRFHQRGIMRGKHNGGAYFVERAEQVHQLHAQLVVEVAGRLIRQNE